MSSPDAFRPRIVRLEVVVDDGVYEGTTDERIAAIIAHELGAYGISLDGFDTARPAPRGDH